MEFEPSDGARIEVDERLALRLPPMQIGNAVASERLVAHSAVRLRRAHP